jgi:hypothetical protein
MIIIVILTVGFVELLLKAAAFVVGFPLYLLCILFAPIVANWPSLKVLDKMFDWWLGKFILARRAGRAYRRALL